MEPLDAIAPAEAPLVAAGALMMAVAAWLLYIDFNHRVLRATALFLAIRGFDNILGQYMAAPGALPADWPALFRVSQYLYVAEVVAAAALAVALLDPARRAPWARRGTAALVAGAALGLLLVPVLMPARYPLEIFTLPHPLAWLTTSRFAAYALLAVFLLRGPANLAELRARALAGFAFLVDPLFLASTLVLGYPFGIQGALRGFLGLTPWTLVPFGAVLAPAVAYVVLLRRRARAEPGFAPTALRLQGALVLAPAGALAVVGSLFAAPGLTLSLHSAVDAVWTAALPVMFAAVVLQGHFFGVRSRVKRAIRQSTVLTAFLAVFLAATELARALAPQGIAPYLGVAASGAMLLAVGRLQRLGDHMADYALGSEHETSGEARRLDAYRAALQSELDSGSDSAEASVKLRGLRAQLGITDRDHAVMERMLRSGAAPAVPGLRPGERFLNRYRVERELGQGGAGKTYLCRDERLGREVVVKALRSARGAEGAGSIVREARAIGNLHHPHVVTLYDIEQVGDEAFIVMEHLAGGSLAKRLEQGPLREEEFRRLADDLLGALEAVHAAGIVHRDVKPSNILLTSSGQAKLADFGVAHLPGFETTAGGTDGHAAVGTIRFMSPEQALGHPATHRSDLYSAAATLYEALTGRRYLEPRPGESAVELQMRAATVEGFDRPVEPPALAAWFAGALRPRAAERFQDAGAMRLALAEALGGHGPSPGSGSAAPLGAPAGS